MVRIKVVRGREPGGLCRYLLSLEKRAPGREQDDPILLSNMFSNSADELAEELRFSADLNPRVQKTVCHYQISFPPKEDPPILTKRAIVSDLLAARGHGDNCQFFAVEHFDQVHKQDVHHLHVVASAVRLDGTWVNGDFEWVALKQVERDLESAHGLKLCPPKPEAERQNLTTGESRLKERTGETLPKEKLWDAIDQAASNHPTMPELLTRLKAQGVEVQFHQHEDGGRGLSFAIDGSKFQGRRLGKSYSLGGLKKHGGIDYQSDRDDEILQQLNSMSVDECRSMLQAQEEKPILSPVLVPIAQPIEPEPSSTETPSTSHPSRENLLNFLHDRLEATKDTQHKGKSIKTKDGLYLVERDECDRITITRLTSDGEKGEIILNATRNQLNRWDVTIDQMEPEDEQNFDRYQAHRQQRQQQSKQKEPKQKQQEL